VGEDIGVMEPFGHELLADYWFVIGKAPGGAEAITNKVAAVRSYFTYPELSIYIST